MLSVQIFWEVEIYLKDEYVSATDGIRTGTDWVRKMLTGAKDQQKNAIIFLEKKNTHSSSEDFPTKIITRGCGPHGVS